MNKPEIELSIIVVGDANIGKTCLVNQLVNKYFDEWSEATISTDIYHYKMEFDHCIVNLTLRDTCGQEQYRSLVSQFFRETHGAVIVYDITSRQSFEIIQDWIVDIHSYCPSGTKMIIVGNKIDLEMENREISFEEGKRYAEEQGYPFFETSAKMNVRVENAFRTLVESILQSNNFKTNNDKRSTIKLRKKEPEEEEHVEEEQPNRKPCTKDASSVIAIKLMLAFS